MQSAAEWRIILASFLLYEGAKYESFAKTVDGGGYKLLAASVIAFFLLAACNNNAGYDDSADYDSGSRLIYTADGLAAWGEAARVEPSLSAALAADIDMAGKEWTPVGTADSPYEGTFDGGGYAISNLKIETSDTFAGLFGYLRGTVKNLGLKNAEITSSDGDIGGIAGASLYGTITGCYSTGSISGSFAGGIVGDNSHGTITDCYSTASVSGSRAGGIVGDNYSGTITDCYSTGSVSRANTVTYAGGIVGYNSSGTITSCYSTASVSGDYAGGIVGENNFGGVITDCYYSTGSVSGDDYAGGIAGNNSYSITACYSTGNVLGGRVGGIAGENSATITGCYSTGSVSGSRAGGIVGYNSYRIIACYSTASVLGDYAGGGIAGDKKDTGIIISGCYWKSDSVSSGVGSGNDPDPTTKVDGTTVTWITAQNNMNVELSGTGYKYSGATGTTPPKLIKS